MAQFNLFTGEPEIDIISIAEIIPDPVPAPLPKKKRKGKQSFEVKRCRKCDQLIMQDPNNDHDNGLCESCDPRLSNQFDKFKNYALIKALRVHKYL